MCDDIFVYKTKYEYVINVVKYIYIYILWGGGGAKELCNTNKRIQSSLQQKTASYSIRNLQQILQYL